jgi:hypothetical protein
MNEGLFSKKTTLNIVANQETIDLPSDFFQVRSLYKIISNGAVILRYDNNLTNSYATDVGSGTESYFPFFYFRNNQLVLRPEPTFSQTAGLSLEYYYLPDMINTAGDRMDVSVTPLFKQLIEMYAVFKAKMSQSLVTGVDMTPVAKANLSDIYTRFIETVKYRAKYPQFTVPFSPESYG